VEGPQLQLTPADVAGVYPAAGSEESPDEFLPHIALERRTLPWERIGINGEVKHQFVKDQESLFQVEANQNTDIVILADPRGGLYATCGALPRKKITMPKEFIQASLAHLEPTFRVGPVFTTKAMGALKALAPPPQIDGFEAEFVYRSAGSGGDPDTFPEAAVPPVPPVGELPRDRAVLSDGWMRVFKPEET
jgi:hypothetical protein